MGERSGSLLPTYMDDMAWHGMDGNPASLKPAMQAGAKRAQFLRKKMINCTYKYN